MTRTAGRKERRDLQRKMLKKAPELSEVPPGRWPQDFNGMGRFAVYESKHYLVQLFREENDVIRISANRTRLRPDGHWDDNISWDELQEIKQQIGYEDHFAIEIYPSRFDEINVANMRHLWVLPRPLNVGWSQFDRKETFEQKNGKPLTYLACPYSHDNRLVRVKRFEAVNEFAGRLMKEGKQVFSPISHTHPIAEVSELPLGWDFWQEYDRAFLEHAKEVIVLMLPGWQDSTGVTAEIKIAKELGIPVRYIESV